MSGPRGERTVTSDDTAATVEAPSRVARAGTLWRTLTGWTLLGPILLIGSAIVLVVAGTLPVWGTRLIAPQYPKGLELWFYGGRVEGPVREVNALNHYIGMREIDLSLVPEMALWPLAVVGAAALFAAALVWRGRLGRLAVLGLWLIPVTVLADIQRWLIIFGSELDPTSALDLDPFVPLVVGPSRVWNFTVWTYPGPALVLIWVVAAAAVLARFGRPATMRLRLSASALALVVAAVGAVLVVVPATQSADEAGRGAAGPPHRATVAGVALQSLIDTAAPGSTLFVPAGTYHERVVIDKPLALVADGEVVVHGGGRGSVITVTASDVTLRGLVVAGSGGQADGGAGVFLSDARRVRVEGLTIRDTFSGIAIHGGGDVWLEGNLVEGAGQVEEDAAHATAAGRPSVAGPMSRDPATANDDPHADHDAHADDPADAPREQGDAFSLWATRGVLLRGNVVRDVRDGVLLNYADEVLIDSNTIGSSRYGIHAMFGNDLTVFGNELRDNLSGLVLMYTRDVLAGRNAIAEHRSPGTGVGVVVKDVVGLRLAENVIAGNRIGLRAEGTARKLDVRAEVLRNRFSGNFVAVSLLASADIGFGGNTFQDNLTHVLALERGIERRNDWTYQGTGNLWSDYAGYDLAGDGTGDQPYVSYGAAQALLAADPALELVVTTPAYQLFAGAQRLWSAGRQPMVVDGSPLTEDAAPPLFTAAGAIPASGMLGWLAASALLTLSGATGFALRGAGRLRTRAGRQASNG